MSILSRRGVTRHTTTDEELEKILVFGYQCKIFNDDEKALEIDRGTHLIPWMGNQSLLIDRYDGRGHLHNLDIYDSKNSHHELLTDKERAIETACDEERYLELNPDYEVTLEREEEEMKRYKNELRGVNSFGAVGFSYNIPDDGYIVGQDNEMINDDEEDDGEEFEAPLYLDLPPDMITPDHVKQHDIILHTAKFIANHGSQMEIMMATKQKHNTKFQFLNTDHELNSYYKHILHIVKIGKYRDDIPVSKQVQVSEAEESSDDDDYLHPSLMKSLSSVSSSIVPVQDSRPPAPPLMTNQIVDTPYARLVSSLCASGYTPNVPNTSKPATPPLPTNENNSPDRLETKEITNEFADNIIMDFIDERNADEVIDSYTADKKNGSTTSSTSDKPFVSTNGDNKYTKVMSQELETAIVKMADFVAKNGLEFESIVRARDTSNRFTFLDVSHPLNVFYTSMRTSAQKKILAEDPKHCSDLSTKPKAISFSIGKSMRDERAEPIGNPKAMMEIMPVIDSIRNRLLKEREEKARSPDSITPPVSPPSSSLLSEVKRERKLKAAIFVGRLPGKRKIEGPQLPKDGQRDMLNKDDEYDRTRDKRNREINDLETDSRHKTRRKERNSDRRRTDSTEKERDRDVESYRDRSRYRDKIRDRDRRSHHKSSRHSKRHRHRTRSRSKNRNIKTKRYEDDVKRRSRRKDHISKSTNKDEIIILSDDDQDEVTPPPLTELNPQLSDKQALQEKIKQLLKVTRESNL